METLVEKPLAQIYCNLVTTSHGICHSAQANMMTHLPRLRSVLSFSCTRLKAMTAVEKHRKIKTQDSIMDQDKLLS